MVKQKKPKGSLERFALATTRWIGSTTSLVLHTLFFLANFVAVWLGMMTFDQMLLILTMIVSLEAIYLAIFIQMSLNYASETIESVERDIEEIQEDVDEIQEDMEEIQEDVEEIQKDVDEIQEDVDEMAEDVEEIVEEDTEEETREKEHVAALASIQSDLRRLMEDIERLKSVEKK